MNSIPLQDAIKLLTGGQAYETPLAADVIEQLALAARMRNTRPTINP